VLWSRLKKSKVSRCDSDNGDNETRVIPVDSLCQSVAVICGHDQVRAGASGYWWQFGFVYD
jgi:hypothetical protein